MKIKEVLQQKKDFKNPIHEAVVNIHYTASWLKEKNNHLVGPYDLSMQQYNVLRILRGQHPKAVTVKFIIERMIDKSSNASRLVDKLLVKELVERHQCPNDRRQVDVSISEKGLKTLADIDVKLDNSINEINLTDEEGQLLSDLLDKLRD